MNGNDVSNDNIVIVIKLVTIMNAVYGTKSVLACVRLRVYIVNVRTCVDVCVCACVYVYVHVYSRTDENMSNKRIIFKRRHIYAQINRRTGS